MKLSLRLTAGVLAVLALALPAVTATAEDDPGPSSFPTIAKPADSDNGESDPQPRSFPTVARPELGSDEDPAPPDWPAPAQG